MSEPELPKESSEVSDTWQQVVQAVLGAVLLAGALAMFHYYAPVTAETPQPDDLPKQLQQLSQEVAPLEQQQAMPALVLKPDRGSLGYIFGIYPVGFANHPASIRARVSCTAF